jgi:hypothetical protein
LKRTGKEVGFPAAIPSDDDIVSRAASVS